jgi:hypothetical protein
MSLLVVIQKCMQKQGVEYKYYRNKQIDLSDPLQDRLNKGIAQARQDIRDIDQLRQIAEAGKRTRDMEIAKANTALKNTALRNAALAELAKKGIPVYNGEIVSGLEMPLASTVGRAITRPTFEGLYAEERAKGKDLVIGNSVVRGVTPKQAEKIRIAYAQAQRATGREKGLAQRLLMAELTPPQQAALASATALSEARRAGEKVGKERKG